jgi:hypothetical protein
MSSKRSNQLSYTPDVSNLSEWKVGRETVRVHLDSLDPRQPCMIAADLFFVRGLGPAVFDGLCRLPKLRTLRKLPPVA